jgi:hypothetical protein
MSYFYPAFDPRTMAAPPPPERRCSDCRGFDFVHDVAAGDVVCRGCGLVSEGCCIDDSYYGATTFADREEGFDPYGGLADDSSTVISSRIYGRYTDLQRCQHALREDGSPSLDASLRLIASTTEDTIKLPEHCGALAADLFKSFCAAHVIKGGHRTAVMAACAHRAYKACRFPRDFRSVAVAFGMLDGYPGAGKARAEVDLHVSACALAPLFAARADDADEAAAAALKRRAAALGRALGAPAGLGRGCVRLFNAADALRRRALAADPAFGAKKDSSVHVAVLWGAARSLGLLATPEQAELFAKHFGTRSALVAGHVAELVAALEKV